MKKLFLFIVVLFLFVCNVNADTCDLADNTNGFCLKGVDENKDQINGIDFIPELVGAEDGIRPGRTFFKVSSDNELLYCSNGVLSTNALTDNYEEIDRNCIFKTENRKSLIYSFMYGYNQNKEAGEYNYYSKYLSGDPKKDYYITQTAVWHFSPPPSKYEKYWTWFGRYNFEEKTYYGISNDTITKISNLVNDATAAENVEASLKLIPESASMNISSDGKYYVSKINVTGRYLNKPISVTVSGVNGVFVSTDVNSTSGNNSISLTDGTLPSVTKIIYVKVPVVNITSFQSNINLSVQSQTVFNDESKIIECHPQKMGVYTNENGEEVVIDNQQPMVNYNLVYTSLTDSINFSAYKFPVKISKEDLNGTILKGAKLVIKQGNTVISTWNTSSEVRTELLAPGKYTLSEVEGPSGYIVNNDIITFVVNDNGKVYVNNKVVDELVVVNKPIIINVSKRIVKKDEELSGATLRIIDVEGNVVKDIEGNSLEWVTSAEPKSFHVAAGTYILEEVKAPSGYELSDEKIEFTVNKDGTVTVFEGVLIKKEVVLENNLIILENTPEPEDLPTGSAVIYVAIGVATIAIGMATFLVFKKYKR